MLVVNTMGKVPGRENDFGRIDAQKTSNPHHSMIIFSLNTEAEVRNANGGSENFDGCPWDTFCEAVLHPIVRNIRPSLREYF